MNHFFKYYITKISFIKFYLTSKNVTVILKWTNFTNFYGKLFKILYFSRKYIIKNLDKKNHVTLP